MVFAVYKVKLRAVSFYRRQSTHTISKPSSEPLLIKIPDHSFNEVGSAGICLLSNKAFLCAEISDRFLRLGFLLVGYFQTTVQARLADV
jgi:hypothetical protein